jgi:uncharacterized protein with ATP-grasp and redox domains
MNTCLECIPCIFRQALDAARRVSDDPAFHERIARDVAGWIQRADLRQSPPVMAERLHRHLRDMTGIADPYAESKKRNNALALSLLPELRAQLARSVEPLALAVRLAIAGNLIDLGPKSDLSEEEVVAAISRAEETPLRGDIEAFRKRAASAADILYLADNAGEIVLDRLLIESLGPERVTVAVRGHPVINDATLEDARTAGLTDLVTVLANGSATPGTVLDGCSDEFRQRFERADLVISKGQGNYETLNEVARDIFFLFKVKCPVVAKMTRLPLGAQALVGPGADAPGKVVA